MGCLGGSSVIQGANSGQPGPEVRLCVENSLESADLVIQQFDPAVIGPGGFRIAPTMKSIRDVFDLFAFGCLLQDIEPLAGISVREAGHRGLSEEMGEQQVPREPGNAPAPVLVF